jgi:hypothetical protein
MGGVLVNGRCEALDQDEKPITGLYPAGATIGGLMGGYRGGYTGANAGRYHRSSRSGKRSTVSEGVESYFAGLLVIPEMLLSGI